MLECSCGWSGELEEQSDCPDCGKALSTEGQTKLPISPRRTGKARKQRRRERRKQEMLSKQKRAVEAELVNSDPVWGLGGQSNDRQSNRLIRQFLKKRWDTDKTTGEILAKHDAERTPRDTALIVTHSLMQRDVLDEKDAQIVNTAIRNLVTMEGQNQKDELQKEPEQHLHLHGEVENPYRHADPEKVLEAKAALARLDEESE